MLKDVAKVGQRGQLKEISDGYALNFLIPKGVAEQATADKVKAWDIKMKAEMESIQKEAAQDAANTKKLEGVVVTVKSSANNTGHLYKQVSVDAIADALKKETGIFVEPKAIIIKMPIKTIGEAAVEVHLGKQKTHLKVSVVAQ